MAEARGVQFHGHNSTAVSPGCIGEDCADQVSVSSARFQDAAPCHDASRLYHARSEGWRGRNYSCDCGNCVAHSQSVNDYCYRRLKALRSEEHTSELQSLRHLVCRL